MSIQSGDPEDWPLSFRLAAGLIIATIGILALSVAESVFRPFFVAVFLTFALRPMTGFLVKKAGSTILGYTLAVGLVGGLCFLGGWIVSNDLAAYDENRAEYRESLKRLEKECQPLLDRIQSFSVRGEKKEDDGEDQATDTEAPETPKQESEDGRKGSEDPEAGGEARDLVSASALEKEGGLHPFFRNKLSSSFVSIAGTGTTAFLSFTSELLVIVVFMVFLMVELDNLPRRIRTIYGSERSRGILRVLDEVDLSIQRYIALKVVISLITALGSALVMWLFGVHYVITFASLVFLLNFIPYIGSLIATMAPALVFLLQAGTSPWETLALVAVLTGVQQLIGNVIEPKIQGEGLGLSPVAILLALGFWGWLWGVTGMILAVPIAVTVKLVLEQFDSTRRIAGLFGESAGEKGPPESPGRPGPGQVEA